MPIEITCANCGAISKRSPSLTFKVMFCNRPCRTEYRRARQTAPYRERVIDGQRIYEHRAVASQVIGRPVARNEIVHHKDGDGHNNHPDNLEVMPQHEHLLLHKEPAWFKEAVSMAELGKSPSLIAKHLGVRYKRVWLALRNRSVKTGKHVYPIAIDIDSAAVVLRSGGSLRKAAKAVGVSHNALSAALRKAGLQHLIPPSMKER